MWRPMFVFLALACLSGSAFTKPNRRPTGKNWRPNGGSRPNGEGSPSGESHPNGGGSPNGGSHPNGGSSPSGGDSPNGGGSPSGGSRPNGEGSPKDGGNTDGGSRPGREGRPGDENRPGNEPKGERKCAAFLEKTKALFTEFPECKPPMLNPRLAGGKDKVNLMARVKAFRARLKAAKAWKKKKGFGRA